MKIQHSLMTIAALSLTACATTYDQPKEDGEFATITFEKGYKDGVGFGKASGQEYGVIGEKGCKKPQRLAYMTWTSGKTKDARIPAGKEISLLAQNINFSGGMAGICASRVTFTPEAGVSYHMSLIERSGNVCFVEFVDVAESEMPADAEVKDNFRCAYDE